MHIISYKKLREAGREHPALSGPLDVWYRISKKAMWKSLVDVRGHLPTADLVGPVSIKGNEYRLITEIFYWEQTLLIRAVLTHAEYDKGRWK